MCLLLGRGTVVGALLCTPNFLRGRHSTALCIMQNTISIAISAMNVNDIDTYSPLLSICNVQMAPQCLPRFWAPRSVVLTTGPSHLSA